MKTKFLTKTLGLILLTGLLFSIQNINAQQDSWEKLGTKKVNFGLDKDVIPITSAEGVFTKLKVKVTAGSLNMHKMVVVYGNGQRDEIQLKHNFGRGGATSVLDLAGNKRVIKKVIFWYDTKNRSRKRATVHLFGKH